MLTARVLKILATAGVALFFTLVAVGNLTDYGSNFAFVGTCWRWTRRFDRPP